MSALGEEHALDVQEEREPDLGDFGKTWVQNRDNQKALLDCFADHLKPETSLCFFSALFKSQGRVVQATWTFWYCNKVAAPQKARISSLRSASDTGDRPGRF